VIQGLEGRKEGRKEGGKVGRWEGGKVGRAGLLLSYSIIAERRIEAKTDICT